MPLSGPPTVTDWMLVNVMGWNQIWYREGDAAEACAALGKVLDWTEVEGGPGTTSMVLVKVQEPSEPHPTYVLSVTGTRGKFHWLRNVVLADPVPPVEGGGKANGNAVAFADRLWPAVDKFALGDAFHDSTKIVCVGHSLGGQVAQVLAHRLQRAGYRRTVCYAVGSPAAGNQEFMDAIPQTWLLANDGDPVPSMPPPLLASDVVRYFGLPVAKGPYTYARPANAQTLHADGSITDDWVPADVPGAVKLIATNGGSLHLEEVYLHRLGAQFNTPEKYAPGSDGYPDPVLLAYSVARKTRDKYVPGRPASSLTGPVFPVVPPGSPGVPPPHAPAPPAPNRGLGAHMGTPALAKSAPAYRVLLKFNMGLWGWSEEYLLWYTAPTFADAEKDAAKLATARRKILDDQASIFGYRVQEYGGSGPHGSEFISDRALGAGPGEVESFDNDNPFVDVQTEPVWDTLLVSFSDETRQYRRNLMLRGMPAEYVTWRKNGDPGLTDVGTGPVTAFVQGLVGGADPVNPNTGLLAGKLAIYGRSKDRAQTGRLDVVRAAINPVCGTDVITPPGQALSWNRGDTVHIHQAGCDQCHVNGMSGDTCVLDTGTNDDGTLTTTVGRRPCCCGPQLVLPSETTIELVTKAFYLVTGATVGRLTSRATGAPFGAGRGRARSCARR